MYYGCIVDVLLVYCWCISQMFTRFLLLFSGVGSSKMLNLMQLQQASVPTSIHNYTPEALDGANTQNLQNPNVSKSMRN